MNFNLVLPLTNLRYQRTFADVIRVYKLKIHRQIKKLLLFYKLKSKEFLDELCNLRFEFWEVVVWLESSQI